MKELAKAYYIEGGCNCAESAVLAAFAARGLSAPKDAVRAISGFGRGMGCGELCGALAGSLAVLGLVLVEDKAHDSAAIRPAGEALTKAFLEKYGNLRCAELRPCHAKPEVRCLSLVEGTLELLEHQLAELGK